MAESTEKRVIRMDEVKKHTTKESLWMVMDNKVYDVTKYLHEHPGGEAVLIEEAGTDATEVFEDVGHSTDARIERDDLYIGDLHPDDILSEEKSKKSTSLNVETRSTSSNSIFQNKLVLSGAIVLGIATVYGLYKYHNQT